MCLVFFSANSEGMQNDYTNVNRLDKRGDYDEFERPQTASPTL